jgi:hypothetical protein
LFIGVSLSVFGTVKVLFDLKREGSIKDDVIGSFRKVILKKTIIVKIRGYLAEIAGLIEEALSWMPSLIQGMSIGRSKPTYNTRSFLLELSNKPIDHYKSLAPLLLILTVCLLSYIGVSGNGYGYPFLTILAVSITFRHVRYVTQSDELPVVLRRTSGNPYILFIIIAIGDFLSLLLAFSVLSSGKLPATLEVTDVLNSARGLFGFQESTKMLLGSEIHILQVIQSISGLLYYLTLLRVLINIKKFKRTDKDYNWIVGRQNMLGNFASAINYSENIKQPNEETFFNNAVSYCGVNRLEDAKNSAKLLIQRRGENPTADLIFAIIHDALLVVTVGSHITREVFYLGMRDGVSDAILMDAISIHLLEESGFFDDHFRCVLNDNKNSYPLTFSLVLLFSDQRAEALNILDRITPGSELEEIVRLTLTLRIKISDTSIEENEYRDILRQWMNREFEIIKSSISDVPNDIGVVIIYFQLIFVRMSCEDLLKEREQEVQYLMNSIKGEAKGNLLIAINAADHRFGLL